MADTPRTLAALLALMADNTTGNISPQDMRDMLVSLQNAHGGYAINTPAPTTISIAGTYVKLAGTTTFDVDVIDFDMPADNRIRFIGSVAQHIHMNIGATMQAVAGTNQVIALQAALNDATAIETVSKATLKAATDQITISLHWDGHMSNGDYIELFGTNETSTNNIQMDTVHIFARSLFGG